MVEDLAREAPRWQARDLCLTGPMPGPKMREAKADAADLEAEVMAGLGLDPAALDELGRHAPGTRRDLLVMPEEVSVAAEGDRLRLRFTLPAGSYATVLLREVMKAEVAADE